MTPYFQTELGQLFNGSARDVTRQFADESFQCCITSPPYWRLRDYQVKGQIGLEATPGEYIAVIVDLFKEVRRTLRKDGTVWINLGDSYSGGTRDYNSFRRDRAHVCVPRLPTPQGFKKKDLLGMPERVILALQADGWYWRSRIPWIKRNCMPESCKDRPNTAVEYVFLLSKSSHYFYDHNAVKLPASPATHARAKNGRSDSHKWADGGPGNQTIARSREAKMNRIPRGWDTGPGSHRALTGRYSPGVNPKALCAGKELERAAQGLKIGSHLGRGPGWRNKQNPSFSAAVVDKVETRARRNSDWLLESFQGLLSNEDGDPLALIVNSQGFKGAHFATFPPKLVEPMILAGSREGDTVLDPFGGACTTGLVAEKRKRRWICIELSEKYCDLSRARIEKFLYGETEPSQERLFPKQERLW